MRPGPDVGWKVNDRRFPSHGWCYMPYAPPPRGCRWCDADLSLSAKGWLYCPSCDQPPPFPPPIVKV